MLRRVATSYKTKVVRNGSTHAVAHKEAGKALLQVIRFDPITNHKRVESYEFDKKQDFMVLDLLTAIKAHQDPSLAFRASCCEGVCGSCAMNINGINSLACVTFAQHVTTVGPLPNFPIIKDLVVDLRNFFRQYEYIRPFVRNVNLHRCHIDSVYRRYTDTCQAIYGTNPEKATKLLSASTKTAPDSKVTALLKVLDTVVAAGSVSHTIQVMLKLKELGMVFDSVQAKALVNDALTNFSK
mmetsp:Transcript_42897/g.49742  ORF Transcript_42897/g.49742 Transcript_42897/m.49742 type:complete len:240 (+) Transcript_42897:61-780(+)|eukprot:CAMPEP_0176435576 /NCGR_PEP_ID=MMETSP0127-20121128/17412_1 /TAXON_ID=938130 /ORGANISM="Platyophrya macrostoma, Strain WH" /LENGTH=239 /DNA_ID=CAMNT_0017818645 /DNA_START=70 /DNA_END=789 /DNA_ORIENTATION=+